jgi:imidazolonepropionase-like amidohydrolase
MASSLIHNGALIDGTGGEPLPDGAVLVEDGRIRAVGRRDDVPRPGGEVAEIDAQGGFILPGFVDAHVHLMLEGADLLKQLTTPLSLHFYRAIAHMRRTVEAGVTSVRDAGGADAGVKRAVEEGLVVGPRMQISISVLTTTGGHADFWLPSGAEVSLFPTYPGNPSGRCDGPDGVRRKVREVLRAGAEVVKVCSTGGVLSPTDHPEFTQFTPEELGVMVQEAAYRRGVKVMAHAQGAEGVKNAVRAGVHSIEHGICLDDEAVELMLRHGTYLVPTLVAPLGVLETAEATGAMPEWGVRKAREVVDVHRDSIARAHRAGVRIAMGTDAAVVPHGTNLRELGLLCDVGMTPMEAIVAATKTAADCLGWGDGVGTLEAGQRADVVVSRIDPVADVRSLATADNILLVLKDGAVVKDRRDNGAAGERQGRPVQAD